MILFSKDCSIALIDRVELSTGYMSGDDFIISKLILSNTKQLKVLRNYFVVIGDEDLLLLHLETGINNLYSIKSVFPIHTEEFGMVKHNIELLNFANCINELLFHKNISNYRVSLSAIAFILDRKNIIENYIYQKIEELIDNELCTKSEILKLLFNDESWRIHWYF